MAHNTGAQARDYTPMVREWNAVQLAPGPFAIAGNAGSSDFYASVGLHGTARWPTGATISLVNGSSVTIASFSQPGTQNVALPAGTYHWQFSPSHAFANSGVALTVAEN